jgi:signal transduction histidine kinase
VEALEREKAIGEILRVMSVSPGDVQPVLEAVAERAAQLCDAPYANVMIRDGEMLHPSALSRLPERTNPLPLPLTRGSVNGRAVIDRRIVHHADVVPLLDTEYPDARQNNQRLGHRAVMAVPLLREGEACGTITVYSHEPRPFSPEQIALVETFARQAVIAIENARRFKETKEALERQTALAIQNARLLREIEDKSRRLEIASQHKSEFLANMSHELRTPLNAIIGFSEVLSERMFGEINEKQAEYIGDILASGQHLLSLINDILDLSKIEAGRMELEPKEFDLPSVIENTLILVRERAQRHGIALGRAADEGLGTIYGDERKVKQVLLNLLSNALKFTPKGGTIDVRAEVRDGVAEI